MRREKRKALLIGGPAGSGKSHLLERLLEAEEQECAVLCMEMGAHAVRAACPVAVYGRRTRRRDENWVHSARQALGNTWTTLYVELNASESVAEAVTALEKLAPGIEIDAVLYLYGPDGERALNSELGDALGSQAREADQLLLSAAPDAKPGRAEREKAKRLLRRVGATGRFRTFLPNRREVSHFAAQWREPKSVGEQSVFFGISVVALIGLFSWSLVQSGNRLWNDFLLTFLGTVLQALPFLVIGVCLSAAIEVFLSRRWLQRFFGLGGLRGLASSLLLSAALPVCDCASVPVFRALVQKNVPLPYAVIFLLAAPVMNPVAFLSTWFAYGRIEMALLRMLLGMLAALLAGYRFFHISKEEVLLSSGSMAWREREMRRDAGRFYRFAQASLTEFRSVFVYLLLGSAVASGIQLCFRTWNVQITGAWGLFSVLGMMGLAFLLSLCSSSDAIVARSMSAYVPPTASLSFLVYGPMMDFKNLLLLSRFFQKRFIVQLVWRTTAAVAVIHLGLAWIGGIL